MYWEVTVHCVEQHEGEDSGVVNIGNHEQKEQLRDGQEEQGTPELTRKQIHTQHKNMMKATSGAEGTEWTSQYCTEEKNSLSSELRRLRLLWRRDVVVERDREASRGAAKQQTSRDLLNPVKQSAVKCSK